MHCKPSVRAFAGVAHLLRQSRQSQTPELLIDEEIGGLLRPEIDANTIQFYVDDSRGSQIGYRVNISTFALLRLIILAGQSVFVNYTRDTPVLKAIGKLDESSGITVARIAAGCDVAEQVRFRNGNNADLTFENLKIVGSKATRGEVDWIKEVLWSARDMPDTYCPGNAERKSAFMHDLFNAALERIEEERVEAAALVE